MNNFEYNLVLTLFSAFLFHKQLKLHTPVELLLVEKEDNNQPFFKDNKLIKAALNSSSTSLYNKAHIMATKRVQEEIIMSLVYEYIKSWQVAFLSQKARFSSLRFHFASFSFP